MRLVRDELHPRYNDWSPTEAWQEVERMREPCDATTIELRVAYSVAFRAGLGQDSPIGSVLHHLRRAR